MNNKNNQNHWTKDYLEALNKKIAQSKTNVKSAPPKQAEIPQEKNNKKNLHKKHKHQKNKKDNAGQNNKIVQPQIQEQKKQQDILTSDRSPKIKDQSINQKNVKQPKARVVGGTVAHIEGQNYFVMTGNQELSCRARFQNLQVKELFVGDHVHITTEQAGTGWIEKVDPRQNQVVNPSQKNQKQDDIVAVNVNQVVVVVSAKEPLIRTDWLDRHLVVFERRGFKPVICCTKIDLADDNLFVEQLDLYRRLGYRLMFVSSLIPSSIFETKLLFKNKTTILSGHVGVGKTSLIQLLLRKQDRALTFDKDHFEWLATDDYTETRAVRSYRLDIGGMIIDTPGIKEYELSDIPKRDLKKYFREFRTVNTQCPSPNCLHYDEPFCAIRQGVADNVISQDRYDSYLKILDGLS